MKPFALSVQHEANGAPGGGSPTAPPPTAAASTAAPQAPASAPAAPVDWEARAKAAETELGKARHEAAGYRTGNKGQLAEAAKALAALAGVTLPDDKPPDVAALVARLDERDKAQAAEMRTLKIDNALGEIFIKHGVKAKLARAVLESEGILRSLDPSDAEFSKTLNAAVKKLSEDYPEIKAVQAPAATATRSTIESQGGNGTVPQLTQAEIANMSPEAVVKARKAGQLNQLMGRQA